jgi:anti-sigma B factor antagonist
VELTEQTSDSCTILGIDGRLDTANYGVLEARLTDLLAGGKLRILVDCSKLDYVSSSGLRVFLNGLKRITAAQGKFVLCSLQENIREIFEISGFSDIFEIYPGRDEALKAFQQ